MNIRYRIRAFCLIVSSLLVMSSYSQSAGSINVRLRGEIIDRPQSSRLLLKKEGEDPRSIEVISIPIVNGKFEYDLNCDHEELYELVFYDEFQRGIWRSVEFFSEHGIINFTLHPDDRFEMNKVEGGKNNREYRDYYSIGSKKEETITNELMAKIEEATKEGLNVDSIAEALQYSAFQEMLRWQLQYIREHPTIVGYGILMSATRNVLQTPFDISPYAEAYQTIFAPRYPDHPYSEQMQTLFTGLSIKAGVSFVDFTTGDLTGKPVKLSDRIAGRPAILHLWASWCGPCRRDGKALIPVYEEFREKGFVVIGVAREKNVATAIAAAELDEYPWENLVELNDAEQIWNKYGIGNAGGSIFLIDEKGIIVAVAPSIEEVRNFLEKKF